MKDVKGCWSGGAWKVQVNDRSLDVNGTTLPATGLQQIKDRFFIESTEHVVLPTFRRVGPRSQPLWVDIQRDGKNARSVRLIDSEFNMTPWLKRG